MDYGDLTKEELIERIKCKDEKIAELEMVVESLNKKLKASSDSENMIKAVLECTTDGIIVRDEKFNIINTNKSLMKIWDIDEEQCRELDGFKLAEHCKDKLVNPEKFVEDIKKVLQENKEYLDYLYFKNGKVVERLFEPLIINGRIKGSLWSFRDITKRNELEKSLKMREELYKRLVNKLPDGIFVYENGDKLVANEAALRIAGAGFKDYKIGKPSCVHPDYKEIVDKRVKRLLEGETEVDFLEQKIFLEDGTTKNVEIAGFSFRQDEKLYVTVIVRDISDRKKVHNLQMDILKQAILLKQAQEYNRLKTQLFSTVSHELKTPLNIILGGIQLLQKKYEKDCCKIKCDPNIIYIGKYLGFMKQNCYRLLRLINNFIDMNKIESGFFKLELQNKNIIEVIENITLSVVSYVESKGIDITFDTEVEEKLTACDGDKLERVILNLLSNAIKFTDVGGSIRVNIYDKGTSVLISVKDTGYGIPKNIQSKIFEPFTQGDSLSKRKAEGSGIGLSLVKSLVELHGGNIRVESEVGKGSEFIIELPIKLIEEDYACVDKVDFMDDKVEKITVEFSDIYA